MSSGYMIIEFTFKDQSLIVIEGPRVKYWIAEGLPDFEGTLNDFCEQFPFHKSVLLKEKIIKEI